MQFEQRSTPEMVEVRLKGRLEFTDHDRLHDLLRVMEDARARPFVVDLSELAFIDSAGLGMLLILQEESESRNIRMFVRGAGGDVRHSIELARINEIITLEA